MNEIVDDLKTIGYYDLAKEWLEAINSDRHLFLVKEEDEN